MIHRFFLTLNSETQMKENEHFLAKSHYLLPKLSPKEEMNGSLVAGA